VFSIENEGLIGVTLISFEDAEEFETKLTLEFSGKKVIYINYFEDRSQLIAISDCGIAVLY